MHDGAVELRCVSLLWFVFTIVAVVFGGVPRELIDTEISTSSVVTLSLSP